MRRPGPIAAVTAALLILMGLPFLRIEFTGVDASVLPTERSARVVQDALDSEFPPGRSAPLYVAAETGDETEAREWAGTLRELPGADAVSEPRQADGLYRIDVVTGADALSDEAQRARARHPRARRAVPTSGWAAGPRRSWTSRPRCGTRSRSRSRCCAGSTLLILFVMTGSVVLPIKALLMNVLSLSAAFGLLVLIFQDGRFESLLAYDSQGALESTQPILLFCVAFGLSTDYGVFLLTRIKEARDSGLADREAVAVGLERTGRIVTFAALLFCIAIGAFATSEVVFIKELGIGTALAVLIDAFIVRALLVPSLMALLGKWNWWAPRPLARLHARLGLAES